MSDLAPFVAATLRDKVVVIDLHAENLALRQQLAASQQVTITGPMGSPVYAIGDFCQGKVDDNSPFIWRVPINSEQQGATNSDANESITWSLLYACPTCRVARFGGYCHVSLTLRLKGRDFYETLRRRGGILIRLNGQELLNFLRERLPGGFSAPIAFVEACCDTMYMKQAMEAWGMPTDGHALDEGVSTPT